ncbi:ferredoxin C 2, chloroplastic-like isoform X1 [Pyrus x bretschneideri]|uniref:ferredoxin C 2, chloroplastic-like isoform X1 n=1 Tax=Pyrus x bretschneideri TaxID=225117 RepID=UPI00202E41E8|nr:ferredoxin C 2, chloroplastic-like isoform X1 [Pyrus x bretschneideri]
MAYPSTRVGVMDHAIPCNPCISLSIHRKPPLNCQITWPNTVTHHSNITKWRRNTTSELQTQVAVNDRTGDYSPSVPTHTVTVHDRQRGVSHQFLVPEDQYILHTAESQDITLPFACRHGCCTSCAVRVKSGELRQPEALGISAELKSKGYALLCVGYPSSDLEVETQDEDEVYWLQFGRYFARGPIDRDDYALELAMGDE